MSVGDSERRPEDELLPVGGAPRASEAIAEQLRRLIVTGEVVSGGVLQPATQLMRRFGVSRPTLREALRILENEQLVSVRRGSRAGVRVLEPSIDAAARISGQTLQATGATLGDLYDAQLAFEPFAARLLAQRRDPRDIVQLRAHLRTLETLLERRDRVGLAVGFARFHHLLVELTGNKVLGLTSGLIAHVLERHQALARARSLDEAEGNPGFDPGLGVKSMRKMIRLIEAGDATAAEAHWREHLDGSNRYWLGMQDRFETISLF